MVDKFHDECGVFAVLNHENAANIVYLGLYALQQRGQESAGIASVSSDRRRSETNIGEAIGSSGAGEQIIAPGTQQIHSEKEMGHVAEIFTEERLKRLPGDIAIGHVRYSTAGGSMLCNAQPLVASTSKGPIAFDLIEATTSREVRAGEVIAIECAEPDPSVRLVHEFTAPREARCIFEHVYFARPDSVIFGNNVAEVRKRFGAQLAREHPVDADVVMPVPDSGVFAALGYAHESRIPFEFGLVRNHYVGRTFIEPKQSIRSFGVKVKLNPVREIVEGKRIVLIDDSIVRGTTSKKIVRMLKDFGAREVHMRISSPPTTVPCYYGIDTPQRRDLIASSSSTEEIRHFIEADSLGYLSEEGMLEAVRNGDDPRRLYCTACFSGRYPMVNDDVEIAAALV